MATVGHFARMEEEKMFLASFHFKNIFLKEYLFSFPEALLIIVETRKEY